MQVTPCISNDSHIYNKVFGLFQDLFGKDSPARQLQLILLSLTIFLLNKSGTIRYLYNHALSELHDIGINNYYRAINEEKFQENWRDTLISLALSIIPEELKCLPILFAVDDTLIEKFGTHFDDIAELYDHCLKNGTTHLLGHCFVTLVMLVPVIIKKRIVYIKIPIEHRLWIPKKYRTTEDDEQSKLVIAKSMIEDAIERIGKDRTYIVMCDSWYSKAPFIDLYNRKDVKISIVCALRSDSTIYYPTKEYCGRGRKPTHGDKINLNDIELISVPGSDLQIGFVKGKIKILNNAEVSLFVTLPKKGGKRKLFMCTDPSIFEGFNIESLPIDDSYMSFLKDHAEFIPFAAYKFRWSILSEKKLYPNILSHAPVWALFIRLGKPAPKKFFRIKNFSIVAKINQFCAYFWLQLTVISGLSGRKHKSIMFR